MKPEQIADIHRKVRDILFGMLLKIAPLFSLLFAGLAFGLLPAIPIYLIVRGACRWSQVKRKEVSPSRKRMAMEAFVFLLGGISLATWDPLWFKLEVSLIAILGLVAWVKAGSSFLADVEPFPPANLIGETPAGAMKNIFIASLVVAPVVNLLLALQFSETTWLLFRTLGFFLWILAFTSLGMWFITRKAEQEST
jgi:intracellular septation protein A